MSDRNEVSAATRKGPTRSEASRTAILDATRAELAEHGWRTFSVDAVAKRASASKQTIYRWWPSIGAMCVDAALGLILPVSEAGRDPQERLAHLLLPIELAARTGEGHAILRAALIAACDDAPAGEAFRAWLGQEIRQPLRMMLTELTGKKIIRRDFDVDEALETLLGPLWHKLLVSRAPIRDGFSHREAGLFLRAYQSVNP